MQKITRRLASLTYLVRPLALTFLGVVLLSLGVAVLLIWIYQTAPMPTFVYYLTLQFLPDAARGILLLMLGLVVLAGGIWHLSGVVVLPLDGERPLGREIVVGYRADRLPRLVVLSGGAGMLVLANLSEHARQLTCITPMQDPIEYYYRASSLFHAQNVDYVVPTPEAPKVYAELDDGTLLNVMHVDYYDKLSPRHVSRLFLSTEETPAIPASLPNGTASNGAPLSQTATASLRLTRPAADAIRTADAIVLGPGSLFESIVPNLLIDELREAVQQSKARKIYICNLMTEPGLTTGFSVSDHIRQIKEYGGFTPDYVLVNVQRIESEIQQLYASAHQTPVYLTPEELEETAVPKSEYVAQRHLIIEDSVVIEADLASAVIQYKASIENPGESRAVRVLRHDPEKLTLAILEVLRRE